MIDVVYTIKIMMMMMVFLFCLFQFNSNNLITQRLIVKVIKANGLADDQGKFILVESCAVRVKFDLCCDHVDQGEYISLLTVQDIV